MTVDDANSAALYELADALDLGLGKFSLHLVRCRYRALRSHLADQLEQICHDEYDFTLERITLEPSAQNLYTSIQTALGSQEEAVGAVRQPQALMVLGLEQLKDLEQVLGATENVREEFRKHFQFPLVLWLDDDTYIRFTRQAPNFASWSPDTTDLAIAPTQLHNSLRQGATDLYKTLLSQNLLTLPVELQQMEDIGGFQLAELGLAVQELQQHGLTLEPEQQAILTVAIALHAANQNHEDLETSKVQMQQSVQLWDEQPQQGDDGLKAGLVLFFLGRHLSWMAERQRRQGLEVGQERWVEVREVLERAMQLFRQGDRPDLVAKCMSVFQRVLARVGDWDTLEHYARWGLDLHRTYDYPLKLAYDYGFLSRVALERQQWQDTETYATQAIAQVDATVEAKSWLKGLYLLHLAKAERALGQPEMAIAHLQEARNYGDRFHPTTYCDILETLRQLRLEQKQYLDAFKLKQERLEVEKDAGIRAFVGAGRLGMAAQSLEGLEDVAPEIEASGRKQDLDQLRERIGRSDYKLIVIHGSSGVGKSSLVNAGLVPLLRKQRIGIQDNLVVLVRTYSTDWLADLAERFSQELQKLRRGSMAAMTLASSPGSFSQEENPSSPGSFSPGRRGDEAEILRELGLSEARVVRTVLIFDQFEEFFFVCQDTAARKPFFEFLSNCLNLPYLKVILSLREDYLHYLLECERLARIDVINNDILNKSNRYELGDFAPKDAQAIIEQLTERSQFHLESELVEQLVQDLAGDTGKVRPIELQIVGAQLQAEGITSLSQYREWGTKDELVKRYVEEVIEDCGTENRRVAELVLYLLTDENNTRPLKTCSELEIGLRTWELTPEIKQLNLVLHILVGSGIVFMLPEHPANRYQLVHDYLVNVIRQQQTSGLIAEIEREREQRKLSEARLKHIEQAKHIFNAAQQQAERESLKPKIKNFPYIGALLITYCIIILRIWGILEPLELAAFDRLMQLRPALPPDRRLLVVEVTEQDSESLERWQSRKQWPMTDALIHQLLSKLQEYEPTVIGLDLYRDIPIPPGNSELTQLFKESDNIVPVCRLGDETKRGTPPPESVPAEQVGFSDLAIDEGGIVRRAFLFHNAEIPEGCNTRFSFSFQLARYYLEKQGIAPQTITLDEQDEHNEQEYLKWGDVIFKPLKPQSGGYNQADAGGYQILLNYRSGDKLADTVTLTDVLEDRVDPSLVKDRIVLIGISDPAENDLFFTPYSSEGYVLETMPGVVVQGQIVSQLLGAVLDGRPLIRNWNESGEWLWILSWSYLGTLLSWQFFRWRFPQSFVFLITILFAVFILVGGCYIAFLLSWWLPLISPLLTLICSAMLMPLIKVNKLEKIKLHRTLEFIINAYREKMAESHTAIEYFLDSNYSRQAIAEVWDNLSVDTLNSCKTLEHITTITEQLAWIPSPLPTSMNAVTPQFLAISQEVKSALNATSPERQNQLLNSSISKLHHLKQSLTFLKYGRKTPVFRTITQRWLDILIAQIG